MRLAVAVNEYETGTSVDDRLVSNFAPRNSTSPAKNERNALSFTVPPMSCSLMPYGVFNPGSSAAVVLVAPGSLPLTRYHAGTSHVSVHENDGTATSMPPTLPPDTLIAPSESGAVSPSAAYPVQIGSSPSSSTHAVVMCSVFVDVSTDSPAGIIFTPPGPSIPNSSGYASMPALP